MNQSRYLIVAIFTLLTGCVANQHREESPGTSGLIAIDTTVEFLAPDRGTLPSSHFPEEIVVIFPYIPGGIFGTPRSAPLFQEHLKGNLDFKLDLAGAIGKLEKDSKPLTGTWTSKGLSVVPKEARLSRIGTFAFDAKTKNELGAGGFIDAESKDNLLLVYVDRPCRIAGSFTLGDEHYSHEIELHSAGFHWIRVRSSDGKRFLLGNYSNNGHVKFSIHLLHMKSI